MIRFESVSKALGGAPVLAALDLEIATGETFVIVGPSGAGKSVVLRHMVRLLTPDEGRVFVGDEAVSEASGDALRRIRERFGVLFQSGALIEWLTVEENVGLPLHECTRQGEDEIREKVRHTIERVGLGEHGRKHPSELSGGMRKRAGLARAIIRDPEIILYDEPTAGLDPVSSRRIDELIAGLQKETGVTSVVVTHDLHSALSIGQRIGMLHGGRIVSLGTPQEFIASTDPEVRAFLEAQYITRRGAWEGGHA